MRILLKCPTRGRKDKFLATIRKWVELADCPEMLGIAVSVDIDDYTMSCFTEEHLPNVAWKKVFRGMSKTKIQACNADMESIDWDWDIVILVSDDMVPEVQGYDNEIRKVMADDLDRVVWIHDGYQNENLNTLNIFGRARYSAWGYMYNPIYKSFFCDNELTDWCRSNPHKCTIIPKVLIRHIHPLVTKEEMDPLYTRNQTYFDEDRRTYEKSKQSVASSRLGFLKLLSRR